MNHQLEEEFKYATKELGWDDARFSVQAAILAVNDAIFRILNVLAEDFNEGSRSSHLSNPLRLKEDDDCYEEDTDTVTRVAQQFTNLMQAKWVGDEHKVQGSENHVERMVKELTNLLNATLEKNQPLARQHEQGIGGICGHHDFKAKRRDLTTEADKPGWNSSTRVARGRSQQQQPLNSLGKASQHSRSISASSRSPQTSNGTPSSFGYAKRFSSGEASCPNRDSRKLLSASDFQRQKQELQRRIRGLGPVPTGTPVRNSPMHPGSQGHHSFPSPSRSASVSTSRSQSPSLTSSPLRRTQQYDMHGRRVRVPPSIPIHRRWESFAAVESHGRAELAAPQHNNAGRPLPASQPDMGAARGMQREAGDMLVAVVNSPDGSLLQRPQRTAPTMPTEEPSVLQLKLYGGDPQESGIVVQSADPTCFASGSSLSTLDNSQPALPAAPSPAAHPDVVHGDLSSSSDGVRKALFTSIEDIPKEFQRLCKESMAEGLNSMGWPRPSAFVRPPLDGGPTSVSSATTGPPPGDGATYSLPAVRLPPGVTTAVPSGDPCPTDATNSLPQAIGASAITFQLESATHSTNHAPRVPDRILSATVTSPPTNASLSHPAPTSVSQMERKPLDLHSAPYFFRIGPGAGTPLHGASSPEEPSRRTPDGTAGKGSPPKQNQQSPKGGKQALAWKEASALVGDTPSPRRTPADRQDPYHVGFTSPEVDRSDVKYVSDVMAEITRSLEQSRQSLAQHTKAMVPMATTSSPNSGSPQRFPRVGSAPVPRPPASVLTAITADFNEFAIVTEPERVPQCSTEELPKHSPGPHHAALEPPHYSTHTLDSATRGTPPRPSHQLAIATVQAVLSAQQPGTAAEGDWLEITLPDHPPS
eukprot:GGOE01053124.1.p1 GENE.GGOE01053124.1~~GGOE01053124.1.p1  ORF type:complete len:871 (-),score=97.69 GGOE01053124.1:174-2786(-)